MYCWDMGKMPRSHIYKPLCITKTMPREWSFLQRRKSLRTLGGNTASTQPQAVKQWIKKENCSRMPLTFQATCSSRCFFSRVQMILDYYPAKKLIKFSVELLYVAILGCYVTLDPEVVKAHTTSL